MTVNISKPSINLREKLSELDKPSGIAGESMLRADSVQEQRNLIGAGRRNLVINGDMAISQRGDYTTASAAVQSTFYLDRWKTYITNVTGNKQNMTGSLRYTATSSATGRLGVLQKVEDFTRLQGKTVTASAVIKSNSSNASFSLWDGVTMQGGASTHTGGGTDETITETFVVDASATTLYLYVRLQDTNGTDVAITSGDYIEFTNVQLETGSVATDFEHRSYGEELALCQRYFYSAADGTANSLGLGVNYTSVYMMGAINFPVTMRTTPTLSAASGTNYYEFVRNSGADFFNSLSLGNRSTNKIGEIYNNTEISGTVGHGGYIRTDNSAVFVHFDAEL